MSKKPQKIEETSASYAAKKAAPAGKPAAQPGGTSGVRHVDDATFRKAATKVFKAHKELFHKLAQ